MTTIFQAKSYCSIAEMVGFKDRFRVHVGQIVLVMLIAEVRQVVDHMMLACQFMPGVLWAWFEFRF